MTPKLFRWGLALGGGGLLGAAHIGVLEVLEENGYLPCAVAGTSAGSLVAALYTAGIRPAAMRQLALDLRREKLFVWNLNPFNFLCVLLRNLMDLTGSFEAMPRGLLNGSRIADFTERVTGGKSLAQVKTPLAIVAADLLSGKRVLFTNAAPVLQPADTVIFRQASLGLAVRASSAIPGVFDPVPHQGCLLADGGLVEMVPVTAARLPGVRKVVAVALGTGETREEPVSIIQTILRGIAVMNQRQTRQELAQADLVITPGVGNVGLSDFDQIPRLLDAGRAAASQALPALRALFG